MIASGDTTAPPNLSPYLLLFYFILFFLSECVGEIVVNWNKVY
jgi:hypothetical protein